MKALLKIPFDEKEQAKQIARNNKVVLFFESGNWEFRGNRIPELLRKYIIPSSMMDDSGCAVDADGNQLITHKKNTIENTFHDPFLSIESEQVEAKKIILNKPSKMMLALQKFKIDKHTSTGEIKLERKIEKINNNVDYYNYVVDMPFNLREQIGQYGGHFNSKYKTYIVKAYQIPNELEKFMSQPYSYEAWIEKFINNGNIRKSITDTYTQKNLIIPRDYQNDAEKIITEAINKKLAGFLLADEVGLGKTITAALMAQNKEFKSILVVTTLSAVAHWRKTFLKFTLFDKEILIINYDRLQKLFKPSDKIYKKVVKTKVAKNKRLTVSGIAPKFDLVIFDESHKLKNINSMRSKLAAKIDEKSLFTLYLSATAGQNPLELSYLKKLLVKMTGHSLEQMKDFELWCKSMNIGVSRGKFGKWIWDGSQESIEKVYNLLFNSTPVAALRRNPSDIAGYPEMSRDLTPLELTSDEWQSYQLLWNEFKTVIQGIKTKSIGDNNKNALVAKLRLRQKASILKIPYTIDFTEDLLENNHQVAISVAFKETLHELVARLNKKGISCSTIYGEQTAVQKEEERIKFQEGINKVILFTVEEAISLHQGEYNNAIRSMIIHDLRWSAISMSQIEGRTHRDGKFSQIYWLYFNDTIEEDIAKIVLRRVIGMKGMVGDNTEVLREIELLLINKV